MEKQNEHLTRESLERAIRKIEEDAEWELRHPFPHFWHPKELEMLKKAGFYKEFFKNRARGQ